MKYHTQKKNTIHIGTAATEMNFQIMSEHVNFADYSEPMYI